MWGENLEDFGQEIERHATFRFECRPGLNCFGKCCMTKIVLTPYDIARLRRFFKLDTDRFLSDCCINYIDTQTGFPSVVLKSKEDGSCIFLRKGGCEAYGSRPGCCRNYPLSRVVDEDRNSRQRSVRYRLQQGGDYCEGFGRGPEWTVGGYCEANGSVPYERANDLFLDIAFAFYRLPHEIRCDKEVQQMIYGAVFNFDRFFGTYGRFPHTALPDDDDEMIVVVRSLALNLMSQLSDHFQR